jgi:hypothetical protein
MKVLTLISAAITAVYVSGFAAITPGSKIPAVDLHKGFPPDMVNIAEYTAGRKVRFFGQCLYLSSCFLS